MDEERRREGVVKPGLEGGFANNYLPLCGSSESQIFGPLVTLLTNALW